MTAKTINGIAVASIKTVNGIARASLKAVGAVGLLPEFTVTAADHGAFIGFGDVDVDFGFGSVSPTAYGGYNIGYLYRQTLDGDFSFLQFALRAFAGSQSFFTRLSINGHNYTSAGATYSAGEWSWPAGSFDDPGLVAAGVYPVTIV